MVASRRDAASDALHCSLDLGSSPEAAFAFICEVEKWPLWLSFLRSARRIDLDPIPFGEGCEVAVRGAIPGDAEEYYEVERFIDGHMVSFVGLYSTRRRIDFRIERKSQSARLVVRLDYPAYGGPLGAFIDRMTARRRLASALDVSLEHFRGLIEFKERTQDRELVDF